jgi:hypothetical protein
LYVDFPSWFRFTWFSQGCPDKYQEIIMSCILSSQLFWWCLLLQGKNFHRICCYIDSPGYSPISAHILNACFVYYSHCSFCKHHIPL